MYSCCVHNQHLSNKCVADVKNGFMLDYPNMVIETDNITLSCGVSKYHYSNEIQWIFTNVTGDRKTTTNSGMYSL